MSAGDALVLNMLQMVVNATFMYIIFAPALFPGVNLPLVQIVAVPLVLVVAVSYVFLAISMPRAGGDFVWLSRTIHPAVGFVESFVLMTFWVSFFGMTATTWIGPSITAMLVDWGTLTQNAALINLPASITTPANLFVVTLVFMAATLLVNLTGTKNLFRVQWLSFLLSVLGVLVFMGLVLVSGHDAFVARFNQASTTSYSEIVNAAQSAGYETGFTASGTMFGIVYAFLIYFGFAWSSFFAGEMKEAHRSQATAIVGAVLLFAVLSWATYQVAYSVIGSNFIHAAAFLAMSGNPAWNLPAAPFLTYLVVFATDNPWLAVLVPFSILGGVFGGFSGFWGMITRVQFAWSFDRLLPTAFSELDQRFHAPRNVLALTFLLSLPFLYLGCFTSVLNFLMYASMGLWVTAAIVGVAAAIFPYRRKDIFDKAPRVVRTKLGAVPLMTILGTLTAIISITVAAFSALPAFTGAPINPNYILIVVVVYLLGAVYYLLANWYNRRRGLDMSVAFREIPPL